VVAVRRRLGGEADWRGVVVVVFFFQAEDGIRDLIVTGVQTCALPISVATTLCSRGVALAARVVARAALSRAAMRFPLPACKKARSEERRVGKECRSRWSREQ